jgi:DNA-binding NarL/FixJ family response regulator
VALLGERLTYKEIAARLNLSEQTVKNHVHHILRKVGAPDCLVVVDRYEWKGLWWQKRKTIIRLTSGSIGESQQAACKIQLRYSNANQGCG